MFFSVLPHFWLTKNNEFLMLLTMLFPFFPYFLLTPTRYFFSFLLFHCLKIQRNSRNLHFRGKKNKNYAFFFSFSLLLHRELLSLHKEFCREKKSALVFPKKIVFAINIINSQINTNYEEKIHLYSMWLYPRRY